MDLKESKTSKSFALKPDSSTYILCIIVIICNIIYIKIISYFYARIFLRIKKIFLFTLGATNKQVSAGHILSIYRNVSKLNLHLYFAYAVNISYLLPVFEHSTKIHQTLTQ